MENPTLFDLNEAIRRWRRELGTSPAFGVETLDELEAHLRDSTLALQSGGLTAAEAFLIAERRLGHRGELELEFGKANVRELWLDRSLWMVLGLLLYFFIRRLSFAPEAVMSNLVLSWGLSAHWAGALFSFAWWAFPFAGTAAVCWFCTRNEQLLARLAHFGLRWWWLTGLGLVLLLYTLLPLANRLRDILLPVLGPTVYNPPGIEGKAAILNAWVWWGQSLEQLTWVVLVPVLAGYVERLRRTESRPVFPANVAGIAADQRDHVQRFQSQGLSLEEACFLAARRAEPWLTIQSEVPTGRPILAERLLWMVVGIVLNMFIYQFLLEPCWFIAALNNRLINQASVYGHVFGGLCLLLGLGLVAAFVATCWHCLTRWHRASQWVASLCMKRPGRAAVGLALIYIGIVLGFWLLGTVLATKTGSGMGIIASEWFHWQYVIIQMIVPVALLLWLTRSRMKPRRA